MRAHKGRKDPDGRVNEPGPEVDPWHQCSIPTRHLIPFHSVSGPNDDDFHALRTADACLPFFQRRRKVGKIYGENTTRQDLRVKVPFCLAEFGSSSLRVGEERKGAVLGVD